MLFLKCLCPELGLERVWDGGPSMSAYELYTPLAGGFGPLALLGRIISS